MLQIYNIYSKITIKKRKDTWIFYLRFLIIFLILVNGLFACTEIAITSVNKNKLTQLIEKKNKSAIVLKQLIDSPSKMLSTIQVAITLSGFFASASAAVTISQELSKFMP